MLLSGPAGTGQAPAGPRHPAVVSNRPPGRKPAPPAWPGSITPCQPSRKPVSLIKNRCQLLDDEEPGFDYLNFGIDERRQ
jgi:hypothetical protein